MGYLDSLSKSGLIASIQPNGTVRLMHDDIITDSIRQMVKNHKEEIIAEIKAASVSNHDGADIDLPEIMPDYHFLWVATDLSSFEDNDPRYGYEVGRNPIYRMLDAPYYAWLRHQMENAKKAYDNGALSDNEYAVLKDRFNVVHEWAVVYIGEEVLRKAIRTTNIKRYIAPCNETIDAYYRTWAEAREVNKARTNQRCRSTEASKLQHLLSTQGYAAISTPIIDDVIIIIRDEYLTLPAKWVGKVKFTLAELKLMIGLPVESVIQIYDVKDIFGGKVVPADNSDGKSVADAKSETVKPVDTIPKPQQLALMDVP